MMVTVELIESCLSNFVATAGLVSAGSSSGAIGSGGGMGCTCMDTSHPIFITYWGIYNQTCNDPPLLLEFILRCILSLRNISFLQSKHKQTTTNTQYSENDKSNR